MATATTTTPEVRLPAARVDGTGNGAPIRVQPTPRPTRRARPVWIGRAVLYVIAILCSCLFMGPFLFSLSSSLKSIPEIHAFPPTLFPSVPQWQNYVKVFQIPGVPFALFYRNTVIITALSVTGTVITATASAYGFARFNWKGRNFWFAILLSTLVLPEEIVLIPKFLMFNNVPRALIGRTLVDTWWPLILPAWFGGGAFNVFLLRQFFMAIPKELDEAAVIDGANTFQILWNVILPLSGPALATVAIFSFLGHWNDFIHPLIFLNSNEKFPLSLGLRYFQQQPTDATEPRDHLLMAASILMLAPAIAVFFVAQRYFVRGIVMSGIKG